MERIHTLLTHPGGAHKDEFLACCVILALRPVPIIRKEPTSEEIGDLGVAVLDVGGEHVPERHNFDHHQLPREHPPTCSLSLVLQHLGLYEDARLFCDWLEPAEWFDSRGPVETARWLGIERSALDSLLSPLDVTLLRRFALATRLEPGEPLWEIMRMIGEDFIAYVRSLRERLDFIARHAELWDIAAGEHSIRVLYLPRTEPLPEEPSMGLERFIESRNLEVVGMVYPDRRGGGYGLSRYNDHPHLDFTRIAGHPLVHFAHTRGFVAKTSAILPQDLKDLILQSCVPVSRG